MMMTKRFNFWMMVLNSVFIAINAFFMMVLEDGTVNFVAAMLCLAGLIAAYIMYTSEHTK